jgi:hypothetical protein
MTIKNYLESSDSKFKINYDYVDVKKVYFQTMYLQPIKGIVKSLFYNPDIAPQLSVVLGNGRGSWGSLSNNISSHLSVNNIQIEINTENSDVLRNSMFYYDGKHKTRVREVQGHLGDYNKMEFVQGGPLLWFENIEYYKKRKIWDRLNKSILTEYANKIGIDLTSDYFFNTKQKSLYVELGATI